MIEHPGLVHLVSQYMGRKARLGGAELPPSGHDLPDRLSGPEAEIERLLPCPSSGNARHNAETLPPAGNLEPGNDAWYGVLFDGIRHD